MGSGRKHGRGVLVSRDLRSGRPRRRARPPASLPRREGVLSGAMIFPGPPILEACPSEDRIGAPGSILALRKAIMRDRKPFAAAATLGAVAGMRTFTAPALVSMRLQRRFWSWRRNRAERFLRKRSVERFLLAAAAAELIGDKLPFVPDRIRPVPLAARAASGALSGWALARERNRPSGSRSPAPWPRSPSPTWRGASAASSRRGPGSPTRSSAPARTSSRSPLRAARGIREAGLRGRCSTRRRHPEDALRRFAPQGRLRGRRISKCDIVDSTSCAF